MPHGEHVRRARATAIGTSGRRRSPRTRRAARTPMQWSTEPNAGFSLAKRTVLPVVERGPFGYPRVNVADQKRDPASLLNWMERMIRARKECPEIGWGAWQILETSSPQVLA